MEITHVSSPDDSRNRLHVPGVGSERIGSGFPPVETEVGSDAAEDITGGIALLRALSDVDDGGRRPCLRFEGVLDQTFDRDAILSMTAPINTEVVHNGWAAEDNIPGTTVCRHRHEKNKRSDIRTLRFAPMRA